jgi:hypothetical protein
LRRCPEYLADLDGFDGLLANAAEYLLKLRKQMEQKTTYSLTRSGSTIVVQEIEDDEPWFLDWK